MKPFLYAAMLLAVYPLAGCADSGGEDDATIGERSESAKGDNSAVETEYDQLIVAFGDSLYAGYGLEGEGFAPELQRALAARGHSVRVVNAGVSGDTTAAGRQRLAFTLDGLDAKPDLVIVGLGGNDMLRGISPAETRANLRAILEELERRDIDAMLTGMMAAPNLGEDYAEQYNTIFPDIAAQFDIPLYPFFLDGVIQRPNLMLADGLHPNAEGIDVVVREMERMVEAQLGSP